MSALPADIAKADAFTSTADPLGGANGPASTVIAGAMATQNALAVRICSFTGCLFGPNYLANAGVRI